MKTLRHHTKGFTLVELLIATVVFSIVLLTASAALIQVGRLYYKGVITNRTQNVARSVMDNVTQAGQFSSGDFTTSTSGSNPTAQILCIGTTRYTYVVGPRRQAKAPNGYDPATNTIKHVLWQDTILNGECTVDKPDLKLDNPNDYEGVANKNRNGQELLDENMRLGKFNIAALAGNTQDVLTADIRVLYGVNEVLNNPNDPATATCISSRLGGQWCAVSELSSVVYRRVE